MKNLLIVIAAGNGSRLGLESPKIFVPIEEHVSIFDKIILENSSFDKIIIVLSPLGLEFAGNYTLPINTILCIQNQATGVKQAIEIAAENCNLSSFDSITLQWGDQPFFTEQYRNIFINKLNANKILIPLVFKEDPYVCFSFVEDRLIILEKRENEVIPKFGFKDIGLFVFTPSKLIDLMYNLNNFPIIGVATNEIRFLKAFELFHEKNQIEYTLDFPSYFEIGFNTKSDLDLVRDLSNFKNKKICI